ncbi:MAG: GDP-mannose 4,6-dehydratase, partial [Candidatus Neomarinimicrobiota bacterium]
YGDGQNVRDWLYVDDHCDAVLQVLAHGGRGETYNVGGNSELTNLTVLETLFQSLEEQADLVREHTEYPPDRDYAGLIEFVPDRPGHDRRYAIASGKIQRELGWQPRESFRTGLGRTVAWYIRNLAWCKEVLQANYDRQRLGLSRTAQV